jgi:hypothetical protein
MADIEEAVERAPVQANSLLSDGVVRLLAHPPFWGFNVSAIRTNFTLKRHRSGAPLSSDSGDVAAGFTNQLGLLNHGK